MSISRTTSHVLELDLKNILVEYRNGVYDTPLSSKTPEYYDQAFTEKVEFYCRLLKRDFKEGDQVLLYNSRLKFFPGKLKSRWSGPFKVKEVKPYGAIVLWSSDGREFTINGQRAKLYLGTKSEDLGTSVPLSDPTTV